MSCAYNQLFDQLCRLLMARFLYHFRDRRNHGMLIVLFQIKALFLNARSSTIGVFVSVPLKYRRSSCRVAITFLTSRYVLEVRDFEVFRQIIALNYDSEQQDYFLQLEKTGRLEADNSERLRCYPIQSWLKDKRKSSLSVLLASNNLETVPPNQSSRTLHLQCACLHTLCLRSLSRVLCVPNAWFSGVIGYL